jgi:uncharacterized protein YecE (DUF72 family)
MKPSKSDSVYRLGTSGWSYTGWRKRFYPNGLAQKEWLPFYAQHFHTVEINMTFYRYPKPETLLGWADRTPPGFKFTLKANRQITHRKKIKDVKNEVRYFYILADHLEDKLGCILFQLPPSLSYDKDLLKNFLSSLSSSHSNVIEFRHQSWYNQETNDLLHTHLVIFCTVSSAKVPGTAKKTAGTAYFRFHGLTGGHTYDYTDDELAKWAASIKRTNVKENYIYFNNDYKAYAVKNAKTLHRYLENP